MAATIGICVVLAALLALAVRRIAKKGTCECSEKNCGCGCAGCGKRVQ